MAMKIYDISMPISNEMPVYKNKEEKKTRIEQKQVNGVRESRITMDSHAGTHFDAPSHMLEDGHGIDKQNKFFHRAIVIDLTKEDIITKEIIEKHEIMKGDFVLLKTRNSFEDHFNPDFVYLDITGVNYLVEIEASGVGIDALGIERNDPEHKTHKMLLSNGLMILEGLRLKDVKEGRYTLIAAPLNITGCDGSPVRALLVEGLDLV